MTLFERSGSCAPHCARRFRPRSNRQNRALRCQRDDTPAWIPQREVEYVDFSPNREFQCVLDHLPPRSDIMISTTTQAAPTDARCEAELGGGGPLHTRTRRERLIKTRIGPHIRRLSVPLLVVIGLSSPAAVEMTKRTPRRKRAQPLCPGASWARSRVARLVSRWSPASLPPKGRRASCLSTSATGVHSACGSPARPLETRPT